eukprot:13082061-Alexandrium_andersonii.AAC.1
MHSHASTRCWRSACRDACFLGRDGAPGLWRSQPFMRAPCLLQCSARRLTTTPCLLSCPPCNVPRMWGR